MDGTCTESCTTCCAVHASGLDESNEAGGGMNVAVITATIGERRRALYTPSQVVPGVRYLCFSDRPVVSRGGWEVHQVERDHSITSVMQAKRMKVMAHEMVPDADAVIWCDAHCRLVCHPVELFDEFDECLGLVCHARGCVYHELRACRRKKKDLSLIHI